MARIGNNVPTFISVALAPCPFCGAPARAHTFCGDTFVSVFCINTGGCGARMVREIKRKETADACAGTLAERWNRRTGGEGAAEDDA